MHYKKRPRSAEEPTLLPIDYQAGANVVMIGRGRRCVHNEGNRRFRAMVKAELQAYSVGRKAKKSSIIKKILRTIRDSCDDGVGFVKQDALTGRFYTATTTAAKVTIAQAFRDALHDYGYKSSKQHKQFKRDVARGKVDPSNLCEACRNNSEEGETDDETNMPPLAAPVAVSPAVTPKVLSGAELSLKFWGDCLDPLVEFESAHPGPPGEEKLTKCDCERIAAEMAAQDAAAAAAAAIAVAETLPVKEVDPFEPIPLENAMEEEEQVVWTAPAPKEEPVPVNHCQPCGVSVMPIVEDLDDEDRATVVWACEFVDCPRCSLIQGRGDFDDLPIQDIRSKLIG